VFKSNYIPLTPWSDSIPASVGVILFGGGWGLVIVMVIFVIKVGRELDLGAEPLMVPVYGLFAAAVLFYVVIIILVSLAD
jgi:hypothetical protein